VLVLALDTSSPSTSCALVDLDSGVVAEALHDPPRKAGDILPGALLDLGPLDRVGALAVGIGPGSFTGLRVGLAAMKALAWARKLPLAGASSLRALAHGMRGLVVPTLEARRGEVYACALDGDRLVAPETVLRARDLPAWVASLGQPARVVGPGALANRDALAGLEVDPEPRAPPARSVAALCADALRGAAYDEAQVFALAPDYLQPASAEVALREGRVGGLARTLDGPPPPVGRTTQRNPT
jgi:tRNA threonylcarbamoyladenosine biosynthesis protein TsaB